jgi:hypothetical protein
MAEADRMLGTYLHLARASSVRRQPMVRDKLLVLAGVQAQQMGLDPISALCRHKILEHNARHMVGQWPTVADALADDEFQSFLKQVRRRYSPEKSEHMLHSLGIELGRERDAYFDDLEYAAALLDARPDQIDAILAADPRPAGNGQHDRWHFDPRVIPWLPERVAGGLFVWAALVFAALMLGVLAFFSFIWSFAN